MPSLFNLRELTMRKNAIHLILPFLVIILSISASNAAVFDRMVPPVGQAMELQTPAPTGRIIVKFTDESQLLVAETGLLGANAETLQRVGNLVAEYTSRGGFERRFQGSMEQIDAERRSGENRIKHALPNLNRYAVVDLSDRADDQSHLLLVLKKFLADPAVETAFLEPRAVPATLGFDAFTGTFNAPAIPANMADNSAEYPQSKADNRSDTPDFSGSQGYLGAAPEGVNAWAVADVPGARGAGLNIVDIEGAWVWAHEDLPNPFYNPGGMLPDQDWRDHGTAVLGVIRAEDNGFGVRGITPDVAIGGVSIQSYSVPEAINLAWRAVAPGDAIVIELHAPGPNANGQGQTGYVPMEYWQDNFGAILIASANGRIVCEAAGNGSEDLDAPVYGYLFDRDYRDSGAILVGAANRYGVPEWFTNYSDRVDLNGWGSMVTTLAYGDLQGEPDNPETEFYTSHFSGTSSATPIVTGAVLALQGIVKEGSDSILDPILMRQILVQTGSPQSGTIHIGPRPDILAAWTETQVGFGTVSGTITDAVSGLPVAGAVLHPEGANFDMVTDETGSFSLGYPAGTMVLEISSFFHDSETVNVEILGGETTILNIPLNPLPTMTVTGHITSQAGGDLTGVRATVLGAPLSPGEISAAGEFTIEGAPEGRPFRVLIDNAPYHGADLIPVSSAATVLADQHLYFQLAEVENNFNLWWENYDDVTGVWTWGTPVAGPANGFSGDKCWGVGMAAEGYPDNAIASLESPQFNLLGSPQALLSFHYWCETEAGMDGVKLQIRHNSSWINLEPESDYDYERINALNAAPGWSGNSDGWRGAVFDLLPYIENFIEFRFFFGSDNSISDGGFYVDDITLDLGDIVTAVQMQPTAAAAFAPRVNVYPNPFNPQTEIAWEISSPGQLNIEVYDARGLLVRKLHHGIVSATVGTQLFDGRDDHGSRLASGMYLVRVSDGVGRQHTSRISLVK